MDTSTYFLYFKGAINSIFALTLGIMGYLEIINAFISILGGSLFLVVSGFTALKLYREWKAEREKNAAKKL
jgi:hypothetical protein